MEDKNEITSFHALGNLPLYDIPYEIVVGNSMADCVLHGETLFPGASLQKALGHSAFSCKMEHPLKKTKYMLLVDCSKEQELAVIMAAEAVEMSWHFIEHLKLTCTQKNHDSQKHIAKSIFEQSTNVIGTYLNKKREESNDDMGDL